MTLLPKCNGRCLSRYDRSTGSDWYTKTIRCLDADSACISWYGTRYLWSLIALWAIVFGLGLSHVLPLVAFFLGMGLIIFGTLAPYLMDALPRPESEDESLLARRKAK